MIIDDNQPTSRQRQLSWYDEPQIIRQDQDLIDLIKSNQYKTALGRGEVDFFSQYISFVDQGPVGLAIWIQVKEYHWDQLVHEINDVIQQVTSGGMLYLAVNKYAAVSKCYDPDLDDDYDLAIVQYITRHIKAKIEKHELCGLDRGLRFNWVHPLSRFWLRISHDH